MKRDFMVYTLKLKSGKKISVHANNRVEAFDKMQFYYREETNGYTYKDLTF